MKVRTLATAPAETDAAAANGEALHLLDGILGVGLANELDEAAVLAHRDLDLQRDVSDSSQIADMEDSRSECHRTEQRRCARYPQR